MRMRRTALLLACLALALVAADWEPGDTGKGKGFEYQVFSQEGEHGIVRYRIRGTVDATPDALVRAVRVIAADPARAPKGQTRQLLSKTDREFVVYTLIDLPPLFDDRDIVTRGVSSSDADSGARRIHWKAVDDVAAPSSDGVVRIHRAEGVWAFTPGEGGATLAEYETYMDPAGALPSWLIQGLLGGWVSEVFENVAREALGS
jgi:hypothetical protein